MNRVKQSLDALEAVIANSRSQLARVEVLSIPGVTSPSMSSSLVNLRRRKAKSLQYVLPSLETSLQPPSQAAGLSVSKATLLSSLPKPCKESHSSSHIHISIPKTHLNRLRQQFKACGLGMTMKERCPVQEKKPRPPKVPSRIRLLRPTGPLTKHEQFMDFLQKVRQSNGVAPANTSMKGYSFYVGRGNNARLIKRVLATRWWWTPCDDMTQAHFIWTPILSGAALDCLEAVSDSPLKTARKLTTNYPLHFGFDKIVRSSQFALLHEQPVDSHLCRVYNRFAQNSELCSKKKLLYNMQQYYSSQGLDVFNILPLSFHVTNTNDPAFREFKHYFDERAASGNLNLWIVKPGEDSCRGRGVHVCNSVKQVRAAMGGSHTFIIQKYLDSPFLLNGRKFDLRCFGLLTCVDGTWQGYYYSEGYVRTAGVEFTLASRSKYVHLTNDAVQQKALTYGKHERANKLSYAELQTHLSQHGVDFETQIQPQIRSIVTDCFKAIAQKIDPQQRQHCFELFGCDFILDSDFKVWLLEVNTNASLSECGGTLTRCLSALLQNVFQLVLDPLFPPPKSYSRKAEAWTKEAMVPNQFELIYADQALS